MMDGASNAAPRISGLPALFDLSGRVALITGSSGGLGLTMAHALCEAGASVILNGRDEARLAGARAELEEHGFTVGTSAFDVTKSAEIGRAVADILAEEAVSTFWSTMREYSTARRFTNSRKTPSGASSKPI